MLPGLIICILPLSAVLAFPLGMFTNDSLTTHGSLLGFRNISTVLKTASSNLSIYGTPPEIARGFEAELLVDVHKPLDPNSASLVAIEAMYQYAQIPWHQEILSDNQVSRRGSDVTIVVTNTQGSLALHQLETSHVIVGLYRGILEMINRPEWFEGVIFLSVMGTAVGSISIFGVGTQGAALNSILTNDTANVATARSLGAQKTVRGQYTDAEDSEILFDWSYESAPFGMLEPRAIFTAVLGGLADAAFYDPELRVNEVNARSAGIGQGPRAYWCNFHLSTGDGYGGPLTIHLVTKTFRDVVGYIMPAVNWYGEYEIDIWYQRKINAYASITKKGPD